MIRRYTNPSLIVNLTYKEELIEIFKKLSIEVVSIYQKEGLTEIKVSFHIYLSDDARQVLEKELEEKTYLIIFED